MSEVFGFDRSGMERVTSAVRTVEALPADEPTRTPTRRNPIPPAVRFVRVTSITATSSRYPGQWQLRDAVAQTWTDGGDAWLEFPNGEVPTTKKYPAILAGQTAAGVAIYAALDATVASGTGGAPSFIRITSSTAATGNLYPGLLQSYTVAGGYADTATTVRVQFPNNEVPGLARIAATDSGETSGGFAVYQAIERPLTVAATDAGTGDSNATYYGISTLNVNQGTGLALTNSSLSCKVAAQSASGTHSGVVDLTTNQRLGTGDKIFDNDVSIDGGLAVNANAEVTSGAIFTVAGVSGTPALGTYIISGANCSFVNCVDDAVGTAPALEVSGNIKGTTINATSAFQANGTSGTSNDYTDGASTSIAFTGGIAVTVT